MHFFNLFMKFCIMAQMRQLFPLSIHKISDIVISVNKCFASAQQIVNLIINDVFSCQVVQLTNSISEKKNSLAPVIKELRPLRQQAQVTFLEIIEILVWNRFNITDAPLASYSKISTRRKGDLSISQILFC